MWGHARVEGAGPPWVNPHYLPMSWPGHISQHYPPTPLFLLPTTTMHCNDDVNVNVTGNVEKNLSGEKMLTVSNKTDETYSGNRTVVLDNNANDSYYFLVAHPHSAGPL